MIWFLKEWWYILKQNNEEIEMIEQIEVNNDDIQESQDEI